MSNDIEALGQQAQLLAEYVHAMPLLERTGDDISGSVVRARDLIDELLRVSPITKPTTYEKSLQAREEMRRAKELGEIRDRFSAEIDKFVAETDAMAAGADVAAAKGVDPQDDMPPGFHDTLNRDPGDGR